jgi:predicted acylesterase/phospholipase RssA
MRFYSERGEEEPVASAAPPAADPDEVVPSRADARARRREYVQFMQGHVERIGIILAGGGAKGAYQAGALKAIHEFLCDYNALHKVKMISGTSIGAWNAMFWLGGMIDSGTRNQPSLEQWWKNLNYRRLVEFPWLYIPFWSSSLLSSTPWRDSF